MTRHSHRPGSDSLAHQAEVPAETLRFYERAHLLPAMASAPTAGDQDAPQLADRLRFIRCARELGFSLAEIRELVALSDRLRAGLDVSQRSIAGQVAVIEAKLVALMRMRQALLTLQERVADRGPRQVCPILAALQDESGE